MSASDARPLPRKGVAFRVTLPILDADGDLVSGAGGLDSEVSIDGGAFADCTNEATEIGSSGIYTLDLSAAEMNGDTVAIIVKTSTAGAKTTPIILYPEEPGDVRVDLVQISGDTAAADNLEAAADGTGYNLGGGAVVAASVTGAVGSVTGAVGSVTGNVGGNVVGSTASVTAGVTLAASAITAIWDKATSALTTAGSIGKLLVDMIDAAITSRSTVTTAQVNTEVVDVLTVDTIPELSQAQPAATPTFRTAIMLLYQALRNQWTQSATEHKIRNDAGTVICKRTLSDDGTTLTGDKLASGP